MRAIGKDEARGEAEAGPGEAETRTSPGPRRAARALGEQGAGAHRSLACAVIALIAVAALALGSAPAAGAAVGHEFLSSLQQAPSGTNLVEPVAVAVDEERGLLFAGDRGSGFVDVFSSAGAYVTRFGGGLVFVSGLAVDEDSGDVYVVDSLSDALLVYKPNGSGGYELLSEWFGIHVPGGEFGQVAGVAVDNSHGASAGDVYVVDGKSLAGGGGAVDVFKPKPAGGEEASEGELVRSLTAGKMEAPNGIAVSRSTGRVLVADSAKAGVYAFDASGALEEKLSGKGSPYGSFKGKEGAGNVTAVAVDDSGAVLVAEAERHAVSQYSSSGTWEGWIVSSPTGPLSEPRGVAVTPAGEVYVADAGLAVVDRFGASVAVPSVETGKLSKSAITRTSAQLAGTVNGEGKASSYRFQYGETEALGSETTAQSAGSGEQTVSATAQNLQAGRAYFYRLVAENENGTNYGLIRSFETDPAVEGLETGAISNLQPQSAVLLGSLKRGGLATQYYFQYGTTSDYGSQSPTPAGDVPPASEEKEEKQPRSLQAELNGLSANTLYHYRLLAENSFGTSYGQDHTFTTSGPPRIADEPASGVTQTEATIHAQISPDQLATTYRLQYGESTGYGQETAEEELAAGSTPLARSATLTGLKLGTTYHYRVIAENEAGTTTGPDQTFTTVASAAVNATYVAGITSSEAMLHTQINPLGNDTHYYFQYGTQPCQSSPGACTDTATPPGEDLGAGSEDVAGEAKLTGLTPGTTYHYRAIAGNSLGVSEGPERTFTTTGESAFALADGRAFEMVSPPDKAGAPVEALTREGGMILAAQDGDSFAYVVNGALGDEVQGNRSPEMQQVLAKRSPSGWSSQDIANPNSKAKGVTAGEAPEYQFFNSDLSTALVEPVGQGAEPPLVAGITQATIYIRDNQTGTYLPLVTEANVAPGVNFSAKVHVISASPDLSHVVLRSAVALLGGRSQAGLYEWSEGKLQYLSVLPGGRPARGAEPEVGYLHDPDNAVSADGSRIVWTLPGGPAEAGRGHLYLRDSSRGETVQLDAAQGVGEPEEGSAQFQSASSDGSRVFFTDKRQLTPDSTANPAKGQEAADLYECEMVEREGKLACELSDLTVDQNPGEHAAVQGLVFGASQDGSSVTLVAQGVLAGNSNGNGEAAQAGAFNLYQAHLGGGKWSTVFIARLSGEDKAEWEGAKLANTAYLTARVSPNGRYLAFMSAAPITGYDNLDASPAAKGARDEEVYLYDADTASLRCISCNPGGARPAGVLDTIESGEGLGLVVDRREIWLGHWLAGSIPGWTAQSLPVAGQPGALFQSRYLSDEGRLYFNSPDALVPAAANGKEDVYQYEPDGAGSCQSESGGCISLISSGASSHESAFLEATPDGSDVFFLTEAQLLSQDTDTAFDIYDARQCSESSPCLSPPAPPPPPCGETASCRPAQPSQQLHGVNPTIGSGSGNLSPAPAQPVKGAVQAEKAVKSKPLTRAQKLAAALKSCRRRYPHAKQRRAACEGQARKRYAVKRKAKKQNSRSARSRAASRGRGAR
jgi:phosphodiesterase/alkaline phosphatase D-like protein